MTHDKWPVVSAFRIFMPRAPPISLASQVVAKIPDAFWAGLPMVKETLPRISFFFPKLHINNFFICRKSISVGCLRSPTLPAIGWHLDKHFDQRFLSDRNKRGSESTTNSLILKYLTKGHDALCSFLHVQCAMTWRQRIVTIVRV